MVRLKIIAALCFSVLSCIASAQSTSTPTATLSLQFNWVPPVARENGVALSAAEIGGYELRYRVKGTTVFSSLVLPNGQLKNYSLSGLGGGEYEFQIAAYDADGLYSGFAAIGYKVNTSNPKPVTGLTVKRLGVDVVEACTASSTCKVVKGDGP